MTSCPGVVGGGGGGGGGSDGDGDGQETLTYATATDAVEEVEVEVDEVKMEAEDHLAREYVQEFVLDHLDPADVKREVSYEYDRWKRDRFAHGECRVVKIFLIFFAREPENV